MVSQGKDGRDHVPCSCRGENQGIREWKTERMEKGEFMKSSYFGGTVIEDEFP